jgi:GLPGLI family protein
MKNYVLLFLLIISLKSVSQIGVVVYEAETINELKFDDNQSEEVKNLLKKINSSKTNYILKFVDSKSIFKKEKKLKINDKEINITEILAGKGIYYTNIEKDIILNQKEFSGQDFLISLPVNKWELKQESKKIGNYICYKATTSREIETRRGKSVRNITAWYAPQIPYNFGPKEYNGLPGLIIELQEDSLLFKTTKISLFTDKEKEIQKPTKGKKVTQKEYDSIVKKIISQNKR